MTNNNQIPTINKTSAILASALAIVVIVLVAVILSMMVTVHNVGTIKAIGVGVFSDSACTQVLSTIDWGSHRPGEQVGVTTFIKDIQNTNLTMTMFTSNWNPTTAPKYLTCTWNYTGVVLRPAQVIPIQMRLSIASNVTGITSFSFDININATEHA